MNPNVLPGPDTLQRTSPNPQVPHAHENREHWTCEIWDSRSAHCSTRSRTFKLTQIYCPRILWDILRCFNHILHWFGIPASNLPNPCGSRSKKSVGLERATLHLRWYFGVWSLAFGNYRHNPGYYSWQYQHTTWSCFAMFHMIKNIQSGLDLLFQSIWDIPFTLERNLPEDLETFNLFQSAMF